MAQLDLLVRRLFNQRIAGDPLERPEDVVHRLGAVQSQDYAGAKWSVGQRVRDGTDAGVERAFAEGKILRTHILRPTWHFIAPGDIAWMLELTAPRVHALNAYYYKRLELDATLFRRSHALLTRELRRGGELTRGEVADILARAGILAEGPRLAYILMQAELEGLICSGTLRGKQHTYALLETRAPHAKSLPPDEALAELTYRFFAGHGPATLPHYVWWSGLSAGRAKAGLAMIRERLSHEILDGGTEWFSIPGPAPKRAGTAAYLIPEYDESLVGYKDLRVPDLPRASRTKSRKDAFYRPLIVGNKRAGTWRRTFMGGAVVIEINLFTPLEPAQWRAVRAAAARYGKFVGMPVTLKRI